ncbi:MAG: hypothetical protein LC687_02770 [Actinobacteria bacterium]|nr:hypothetical protein [Actinomycetota bacterium]
MSLVATSGGTDSNAFCDVATADLYHLNRLFNQGWSEASTKDKESSIISATRLLNDLDWSGNLDLYSDQSLRFPRENLYDKDGRELTGIPTFLVNATCELALELLRSEDVSQTVGTKRIKAGSVEMEYYETPYSGSMLPKSIQYIINPFLVSGYLNVKLVRS